MPSPTLLVATRNPGKMREYRQLLADYSGRLISLDDAGVPDEVEETGDTFHANAILKAATYASLSGHLTISDDSGLEVHALGGDPGVYSARYGGDACQSDADRVILLLQNLAHVPWEQRIARFRCCTAIADPRAGGEPHVATVVGSVAGMIQYEPAGEHGFGYDPVFYLPSYGATMAELPLAAKNRVSHRTDAARKARQILNSL
ncbi:MAG: RdgB/HAM1 family non-canonical purine NTP pyrophosphatase [Chloroflexota bacterium]|nr:RdgB/HAM1 family non-canonical purine NTP pyrophosphatase [Chloroflexota bacterium]MDE2682697.1 RdgB/HAM1 family non-canonical purine NTP pyrophosphatase [Chloroflexota bacterium]